MLSYALKLETFFTKFKEVVVFPTSVSCSNAVVSIQSHVTSLCLYEKCSPPITNHFPLRPNFPQKGTSGGEFAKNHTKAIVFLN